MEYAQICSFESNKPQKGFEHDGKAKELIKPEVLRKEGVNRKFQTARSVYYGEVFERDWLLIGENT